MILSIGIRAALALGLIALVALVVLVSGDPEAAMLILVIGAAAVLLVRLGGEPVAPPAPAPGPSEPALGDVIEVLSEPVIVIAANRVTAANRAARTLLGQHILGEDVRIAIRHPAAAERLLNQAEAVPGAPIHLVGLGERDQRWEMRVRDLGGMRVVHLSDRTGSYATERMRVDFVANASHELRTPLASLLGYVETLQEEAGEDADVRNRFLGIMDVEARRMQRLIDDLISLSRIEAEKYSKPKDDVDLAALIAEVHTELSASHGKRGGDVSVEAVATPLVRGDRVQLSQLLHNIIGNAMKYGREGTPVTVKLGPVGTMAQISVADEGEGIPPEHIPRLTERFYRVDSGRSRTLGGTGLGLAIVKHVVERHRGRLDIASSVGKGTTVTILLPTLS